MGEADSTNGGKIAVRLTEVGPRLQLQLVKVEEGVLNGAVLFHRYLTRTPTEQEVLEQRARQRRKLKERNARLDQAARDNNAKLKRKRQDKEKAQAKKRAIRRWRCYQSQGFVGAQPGDSDSERDAGRSRSTSKPQKKRFHPFAWGAKAGKVSTEKTVEIDGRPSKPKSQRGGRRQKVGAESGKGGKKGGKGGGKGGAAQK